MRPPGKEWFLNQALRIDDDVAEALYSETRSVPTYTKSQITPLKNNYNGVTPDPGYIPGWHLTLDGLASGVSVALDIRSLMTRFSMQRADYAAGLRRRLERDRVVGWSEIRRFASRLPTCVAG